MFLLLIARKEAQSYLIRYGITHDEMDDQELLATVKQYKDLAVLNAELFGNRVDRLLEGLDRKLAITLPEAHQRERLLNDIERVLRQLEVQGEMTRDHVHAQLLDPNNRVAVSSSHFLTPEQWQDVVQDVEETVSPPSTWSSWLRGTRIGDKDPYHVWLDDTTVQSSQWLPVRKQKTLKTALDKAMKQEALGSKHWWQRLLKELHGFSDAEIESTIDHLRIKIVGFKVFAHDYLGLPTPPPVYQEHGDSPSSSPISWLMYWIRRCRQHLSNQASSFFAEKKAHSKQIQDEWSHAIHNAKQSFAQYWLDREYDAYRRLGYTEGEIAWIHGYLNKALSSSSQHSFNQIIADVRSHLNAVGRQTKAQVELHVLKLDRLLQAWKISLIGI
ncbi:hypothetical protein [Absidia glauca]|uniref:Uncharacterized protein n=1 Tax=Absidia glauca TaxID=4829 RepID=A0A163JFB0_ABSGL|nr:hypothetical protein [Absidia glauca]